MDKLSPVNDTWLSGKPYYCKLCGLGYGEFMACEEVGCELESIENAQARLRATLSGSSSSGADNGRS